MDLKFREAQIEDTEEILRMMKDFNAIDNYPFEKELRQQNIQKFINGKDLGRLWMILDSTTIIGYVVLAFSFSFEFKGRDAFIDELYLEKAHRSKGAGGATLEFVFQQATSLGVKAIHLEVERHNEKGNALYQKKGFKNHERFLMTKFL
jgi:GNAT superfamily N-acetyltransferase